MGNPLAMLLQQLAGQGQGSGAPPSAPTPAPSPAMSAPGPSPTAAPAAAPAPNPMSAVLSQAMSRMQSSPFGPTPSGGGPIDPSMHPVLAKVIQALSGAAGAYGWTGMPPQEREARTQMDVQKSEAMGRLAQAGVAQEQTAQWRQSEAETARMRQQTAEEDVKRKEERDKTLADIQRQGLDVKRDMNEIRKNATEGRLAVAHQQLEQRASQFEQSFQLRAKQVGIEQAKLELMEQGNAIKQGFLDVARGALSQKGTVEADQINAKLQEFSREHWIASSVFGFPDIGELTGQSRGAGIPGVPVPTTGAAPAATTAPSTPPKPTTPAKTPPKPKGGAATFNYDKQGNRITAPAPGPS